MNISDEKKKILIRHLENSDYEPYIEKAMYRLNESNTFCKICEEYTLGSELTYSYPNGKHNIFNSVNATESYISYDAVTISGNYAVFKYTIDLDNMYWVDLAKDKEEIRSAFTFVELVRVSI